MFVQGAFSFLAETLITCCAVGWLCCAVLGILVYVKYTPVPARHAPCTPTARDGFQSFLKPMARKGTDREFSKKNVVCPLSVRTARQRQRRKRPENQRNL